MKQDKVTGRGGTLALMGIATTASAILAGLFASRLAGANTSRVDHISLNLSPPTAMAVTSTGAVSVVGIARSGAGVLERFNPGSSRTRVILRVSGYPQAVAVTGKATFIAATSSLNGEDGSLYRVTSGRMRRVLGGVSGRPVLLQAIGGRLYEVTTRGGRCRVAIYDQSGKLLHLAAFEGLPIGNPPAVAGSHGLDILLRLMNGRSVLERVNAMGRPTDPPVVLPGFPESVGLSSSGTWIATSEQAGGRPRATVWRLANGRLRTAVRLRAVNVLVADPHGLWIVSLQRVLRLSMHQATLRLKATLSTPSAKSASSGPGGVWILDTTSGRLTRVSTT